MFIVNRVCVFIVTLDSSYEIRSGTKTIASNAFLYCYGLTNITFPNNVTHIGDGAFADCDGLAKLDIPDTVENIGEEAFLGCKKITSVVLPRGLKEINFRTFSYCSGLKSIYIPKNIEKIGLFDGCDNLTDVYYEGNKNDWDLVSVEEHQDHYGDSSLLNATIHYNSTMPSEATPTPKPTLTPTQKPTPTIKPTTDPNAPAVEIAEVSENFVTAKVNNYDDVDAQVILTVYNKNGALIEMQNYYNFGEVIFYSENLQDANIKSV